ncbi:nucleoside-diphosphate sugar epimerase [Arthrobacter sp. MYb224]|uniref:NAD-dependent epimerase/dehydratase family protein n=1 Tax=Micrococcaceae TaxID=1268 RepID=UPI000CFCE62B|nr:MULTISPECIES: GDP-mannose 4,6-dehydratase [unclassified Arthrobacter]PQZ97008.1 nucleoside-diphosphate sugar epimerase [Arthrobacter sp. MYb224]PQZ99194.1 nucleoside-diphosphate sugar epimerase [Arthrobacter sp. MYb229]PRB47579.1 nucleoside-diphosphate sugar epimerase [Arthrobacter sp. MYb216]
MRTVITGGAGFIGSHLADYLLAAGDEVTVFDDLSTGTVDNLTEAFKSPKFNFIEGTVLDKEAVSSAIAGADRVFHLAAAVGVQLIVEQPLVSLRTNIHGTENVLDAVKAAGAKLLLASTSEVYGKNSTDALSEDSDRILGDALKSRWTYAAAKGIDEAFAHGYWNEYGVPVSIVRLFNTVGPRQTGRYGMVVPNLIGQALTGQPLSVFGDGKQTRCFSYVGDVVPALVALIENERSYGQAYNLGGSQEISIGALAEQILQRVGGQSTIELIPYDQAYAPGYEDMRRRVPDNTKANRLIGFVPHTNVEQIIDHVAKDLESRGALNERLMGRPGAMLKIAV